MTPALVAAVLLAASAGEELEGARAAIDALDYRRALSLAEAVVQRSDVTRAMQVEGWWIHGQAVAVLRDPVEAEPSFRTLLRLDPRFEPPADPGPKIIAVFRKVQVEERRIADELARRAREDLVSRLALTGSGPAKVRGGRPVPFSFHLKDPTGAVDEVKLSYRLETGAYSSLALTRGEDGQYSGAVPGEFTANEGGAKLSYFVEAIDGHGRLVGQGAADAPLEVELTPGRAGRALPRHWLYGSLGATVAAGAVTVGLGLAALIAERSHAAVATPMPGFEPVSAQDWYASQLTAQRLIVSALIGLGTTAVLGVVTAILSRYVESPD